MIDERRRKEELREIAKAAATAAVAVVTADKDRIREKGINKSKIKDRDSEVEKVKDRTLLISSPVMIT